MHLFGRTDVIKVGARNSPLSRAQLREVELELQHHVPEITFDPIFIETTGDRDLLTSLQTLDKTDFFTREIDAMQLAGDVRIAIHSAKDLPDPLPLGLAIGAITKGIDSSDTLVLRKGECLESLPSHAKIGVSSSRRAEVLRTLRSDLCCVDIRGTIERRLQFLDEGVIDGVIVAQAALIRLKLCHRSTLILAGETALLQGRLAVVIRSEDVEMRTLFSKIDV